MFSKQVFKNKGSTFLKFIGFYKMKVKKTPHCNVVLDINSTKSSFIKLDFTVFVNIKMNIRMVLCYLKRF